MYANQRPKIDLGPCHECSEFLVDIGFAPYCPGCDRELLRKLQSEALASALVAKGQPVLSVETPSLVGREPLSSLVEVRR